MANTKFQLKRSTVSGVTPTTGDVATGELGINVTDGKLFSSNGSIVFELGANLSSLSVTGTANVTGNVTLGSSAFFVGNGASITTINASSVATGTLPNARLDANVVNTSAAFTITGIHTHSANTIFNNWVDLKIYVEAESAPTISAGTLTLDLANSSVFDVSLNADITTLTVSNTPATAGKASGFVLVFTADGTPRAVNWGSLIRWANNAPPTITNATSKRDVYTFFTTDNGTSYNGFITGQNI